MRMMMCGVVSGMPVEHHSLTTPSLSHSSAESVQVDCLPMHLRRAKINSAPLECRDSEGFLHYEGVSPSGRIAFTDSVYELNYEGMHCSNASSVRPGQHL